MSQTRSGCLPLLRRGARWTSRTFWTRSLRSLERPHSSNVIHDAATPPLAHLLEYFSPYRRVSGLRLPSLRIDLIHYGITATAKIARCVAATISPVTLMVRPTTDSS
jgi:hypothetical protein